VIYLTGGLLMLKYGVTGLTVGDVTVMVALLERLYRPVNSLLNMQVEIVRSEQAGCDKACRAGRRSGIPERKLPLQRRLANTP